jgi:hypothetical protein
MVSQKVLNRHPGRGRGPEVVEFAGFRVKHGMTKKEESYFYEFINFDLSFNSGYYHLVIDY